MKIVNTRFRSGAKLPGNLDKEQALKRLNEIANSKNGLTRAAALQERTRTGSPLRSFFTEDPGVAAEAWWSKEASDMLGMVITTMVEDNGDRSDVRRWLPSHFQVAYEQGSDDSHAGSVYLPIERIASNKEAREEQRLIALVELKRWADRWSWMRRDFKEVFAAIRKNSATEEKRVA